MSKDDQNKIQQLIKRAKKVELKQANVLAFGNQFLFGDAGQSILINSAVQRVRQSLVRAHYA